MVELVKESWATKVQARKQYEAAALRLEEETKILDSLFLEKQRQHALLLGLPLPAAGKRQNVSAATTPAANSDAAQAGGSADRNTDGAKSNDCASCTARSRALKEYSRRCVPLVATLLWHSVG